MRDTQGLRTRIALLACVPGLLACSPPPKPQPVDEEDATTRRRRAAMERRRGAEEDGEEPRVGERRKRYYDAKARQLGKSREEVTPKAQLDAEREDAIRKRRREAAARRAEQKRPDADPKTPPPHVAPGAEPNTVSTTVPGDPPWIDGYNPEEEHCISGNWCGAIDAVEPLAVVGVPETIGCATRIGGGKSSESIKADPKTYAGLSSAPNMQGSINEHGTELLRAKSGSDQMCCYHWFEYCSGRPHLGEDGPVLASLQPGHVWAGERDPALAGPDPLSERIASQWLEDARAEHASVAAFARATLELMAVGAPPDLLVGAQQASLDEIDHTQRCLRLAQRYGAPALQPGPLPALSPRPSEPARLAADTFAEGCVGETIAALVAERAARHCTDPKVAAQLRCIADDEARHAALAWATVAWAVRMGGRPVADRLAEAADALQRSQHDPLPPAESDDAALAAHGRLGARALATAAADAWREIIGPMLESLMAKPSIGAGDCARA